jgi:hypothetical protein
MKLKFPPQFFDKHWNIKFHENPSSVIRVIARGRTDGTNMTKLTVGFLKFLRTRPRLARRAARLTKRSEFRRLEPLFTEFEPPFRANRTDVTVHHCTHISTHHYMTRAPVRSDFEAKTLQEFLSPPVLHAFRFHHSLWFYHPRVIWRKVMQITSSYTCICILKLTSIQYRGHISGNFTLNTVYS